MQKRILVVDDDDAIRRMMEKVLAFAGYDVEGAAGGEEALELVAQGPYNLVLLDVMMPGMDGFEVGRAIRRMGNEAPRVIFVTARDDSKSMREGLFASGGMMYLTKPFTSTKLLGVVKAAIGN